jgi:hypothetical protein
MNRVASVCFVVAFVFASLPAHAQGGPPPNYQALVSQVATLTARVTTLQGQVDKLEGNIVASDLAGTYNITGLSTTMSAFHPGTPPIPATINTSAFRATLTLNADGTGVTSAFTGEGSTLTLTGAMTGVGGNEPADTVTWTYANGVITITFQQDGDEIPFTVALGGRLLIMAYAPFHPSDPSSDQFQIIATRLR